MRVSKDFIPREIAGEFMLVPIGQATSNFNGLITMNEIAKFIFDILQNDCTKEDVVKEILKEYDVDKKTAETDFEEFLKQLKEIGALVEE